MDKKTTCAIMGYTLEEFAFGYESSNPLSIRMRIKLACEIERCIKNGFRTFITDMEQGIGLWAAETIRDIRRQEFPDIQLCAILPFEGQANRWSETYQENYYDLLSECVHVQTLLNREESGCREACRKQMIDQGKHVILTSNRTDDHMNGLLDYARSKSCSISVLYEGEENVRRIEPFIRLIQ